LKIYIVRKVKESGFGALEHWGGKKKMGTKLILGREKIE
jgi:hypothetical protein